MNNLIDYELRLELDELKVEDFMINHMNEKGRFLCI